MEQRTGQVALSGELPVGAHCPWGAAASGLYDCELLHTTAVHCTVVSPTSKQLAVMLVALVCLDRKPSALYLPVSRQKYHPARIT